MNIDGIFNSQKFYTQIKIIIEQYLIELEYIHNLRAILNHSDVILLMNYTT